MKLYGDSHLSRAYPALCPHCRSHLPSVPSSSLCESSSLLLQSRQKLNFGSPKNSTGPRSAFTSPNVKIGSPLTSTPVAGVPAQMKASYLGGFPIHSTHINLGKIITICLVKMFFYVNDNLHQTLFLLFRSLQLYLTNQNF